METSFRSTKTVKSVLKSFYRLVGEILVLQRGQDFKENENGKYVERKTRIE